MPGQVFFIFGLGYVGQHFGRALMAEGWRVKGTTRTQGQAQNLKSQGFKAFVWDGTSPLPKKYLESITHILVTIPPNEKGDVVLQHHHFSTASIRWVGYVSSTSVYGDHQGDWVTENSPLKPTSLRGCLRLLAETQWLERKAKDPAFPLHIFRLSGIYGPGRSVLETIRSASARRIDKPEHVFSRIHIHDIISVLRSSVAHPQPGEIYNLADDAPAATSDVIVYGCGLLNMAVPPLIPFEEASLPQGLQEFYSENKRVSNHKIKESLGIHLHYPTYREGLKSC
jgi:nucleoside-diphosphate-sugar epimerase